MIAGAPSRYGPLFRDYAVLPYPDTSVSGIVASVQMPAGYIVALVQFFISGYAGPGTAWIERHVGARSSGGTEVVKAPQDSGLGSISAGGARVFAYSPSNGSNGTNIVVSGSAGAGASSGLVYYSETALPRTGPLLIRPGEVVTLRIALAALLMTGTVVIDYYEEGSTSSIAAPTASPSQD